MDKWRLLVVGHNLAKYIKNPKNYAIYGNPVVSEEPCVINDSKIFFSMQ